MALLCTNNYQLFPNILQKQIRGVCYTLFVMVFSIAAYGQSNINRVEYYIDIDPGIGKGAPISVAPGTDLQNLNVPINPASLSEGIHRFYVRAKTQSNAWSLTSSWLFYKPYSSLSTPPPAIAPNITRIEYYIDTDPGIGKAAPITITAGANISNLVIPINPGNLSEGVHRLYARARTVTGKWSLTSTLLFYKPYGSLSAPPPANAPNITRLEYYLDIDPGVGKATSLAITPGANLSNLIIPINPTNLGEGVHRLYTRARNATGQWSLTNSILFYKPYGNSGVPPLAAVPNLKKLEYYVDNDPGFGKGISVDFATTKNLSGLVIPIDIGGLAAGDHTANFRAQDENGAWALTNKIDFKVQTPSQFIVTVGNINSALCAG
jgi:hypothetical protein